MSTFWRLSYREAKAIAVILAVVLWSFAAVFIFATPGYRSIAGPLKGGDFIQFYAMGAAAKAAADGRLYDADRLHAVQTALVPESDPELYLPVYPPQTWLLFTPFTALSYGAAATLWTLVIVAVYAWVVHGTWRVLRDALPNGRFIAILAAAFPPFWNLVLHGQNTIIPLAAFFLAWRALERNHKILAGFVLGVLFFKPQFGVALAVIVLFNLEMGMLAGIAASAALQVAVVAGTLDVSALMDYARFMQQVTAVEHLIEPKPFELHSIRALTRLVPNWLGTTLWVAASAVVLQRALIVWRGADNAAVRMAALVLATVLVSPHLFLYDATVLALPFLWIGAWVERDAGARARLADRFGTLVAGLYAAFVLPIARVMFVQVSVLLMAWMHLALADAVVRTTEGRTPAKVGADPPALGGDT